MKNLIRILATACTLLATIGCNKKSNYTPINSELKKKCCFKEGSYWIYRDSVTGKEDSFYVTSYVNKIVDDENGVPEKVGIIIRQNKLNSPITDSIGINLVLTGNSMSITITKPTTGGNWTYGYGGNWAYGYGNAPFPWNEIIPSFIVNGKTYERVVKVKTVAEKAQINNGLLHLKDSVGFVKMDLSLDSTHQVYELERYHINY